jgi:hemerythrin-like metal-binding protein
MGSIQWNCPMPIGVAQLDEQHWGLHRHLWRLLRTLETVPFGALPEYRFIQLYEKTFEHFRTEEAFLQTIGYPDLVAHRFAHEKILDGFREGMSRWNAPSTPSLAELVEDFGKMTQHHYDEADCAFATWLEEKL